jgi:hypothetical protein
LLKIERHQRLESFSVGGRKSVEGIFYGASKVGECRMVSAVESPTFDERPLDSGPTDADNLGSLLPSNPVVQQPKHEHLFRMRGLG